MKLISSCLSAYDKTNDIAMGHVEFSGIALWLEANLDLVEKPVTSALCQQFYQASKNQFTC